MSAIELLSESRGGSTDASKRERLVRYYVSKTGEIALKDEQLPRIGSIYAFDDPASPFPLRADRYDHRPAGDAVGTLVDVIYSNDRRGRLNPVPDRTAPTFQSWLITHQDTTAIIPTIMSYPMKVPGVSGSEGNTPGVTLRPYQIAETVGIYQIEVPITGLSTDGIGIIRRQQNKLHKLGTHWYRFKVGRIMQSERGVWQAQYTWIGDEGTPAITGLPLSQSEPGGPLVWLLTNDRKLYFPPTTNNLLDPTDPNDYTRPPFHVITYILDENMEPHYKWFCSYGVQADGWRSLPGNLHL